MSPEHSFRKRWVPAAPFSITTTTAGWTSTWSTAGRAISSSPSKPLRNALYKNNRDGTFTDVTEKAGVAGGTFGMGVAVGDYDNDGWPDIFVTAYGRAHSLSQQRRRHVHRRDREGGRGRARAGRPAPSGSITTTTACSISSSAASSITGWTSASARAATTRLGTLLSTAFRTSSSRRRASCYHNNGDGTFTRGQAGHGYRASARQRPSASSPPISTTTAAWICLSPTTPCRTFCS